MLSYLKLQEDGRNRWMSAEAINTNLLLIYFGQFMETDGMRVTIIVSPPKMKLARHSLVNNYTTNNIKIYRRESWNWTKSFLCPPLTLIVSLLVCVILIHIATTKLTTNLDALIFPAFSTLIVHCSSAVTISFRSRWVFRGQFYVNFLTHCQCTSSTCEYVNARTLSEMYRSR